MSFTTIKPYFQARMQAVGGGLKEWEDAFNIENIPSNVLDKAWHIAFESSNYRGTAHTCLTFSAPVKLSVCFKGYRNPQEAVDTAWVFADAIVKECCASIPRLNQPSIKNVLPNTVNIRSLAATNDNVAVLELGFVCEVKIEPN